MKEYDFLVFIGRFQPFHNGHKRVIDRALELAHCVIILVGSSFTARSFRNPFLFDERKDMILNSFPKEQGRLCILPLEDALYNDGHWVESVQKTVEHGIFECTEAHSAPWALELRHATREPNVGLIGHSKDHTGYYLNMFPQWGKHVEVPGYDEQRLLDATWIRELYFNEEGDSQLMNMVLPAVVPEGTMNFLKKFRSGEQAEVVGNEFEWLVHENEYVQKYKRQWAGTPYPVTFVTVDAVVVQSGHVLLVKRKAAPGKGLLALPGGFLNQGESLEQGMIRELLEETRLKVAERVLRGSVAGFEVFDDPNRSARGRVITNAYLINLEPQPRLPKVRGGSDASHAFWLPMKDLDRTTLFEDHYFIIRRLTATL